MASWMIYSGMIGALAWIGALCLEPIAAARGLPRRIVWIGAFALALGWPAVNAALRARPAQRIRASPRAHLRSLLALSFPRRLLRHASLAQ